MSDNKQPVDNHDEDGECITEERTDHRADTGIGGALVGAAIGSVLGRRVGGVFGAVMGAGAGALVGKGTAERVNRTVEGVVDAAKSIAEGVNDSVKDVGTALRDTVDEVKPSVIGVVDAVKDIAVDAKPSVIGVVNTLKDTVDEVKPSVIGVVDAVKSAVDEVKPSIVGVVDGVRDTVDEVKPSIVGAAKSFVEGVNDSLKGVGDVLKDTVEESKQSVVGVVDAVKDADVEVKPSLTGVNDAPQVTSEEVKPSDNHNGKLYKQRLVRVHMSRTIQKHPPSKDVNEEVHQTLKHLQQSNNLKNIDLKTIEYKNLQQTQAEGKGKQQETAQQKQQNILLGTEKIQKVTGIIVGSAIITWMGVTWGFSSKPNLLEIKLPESNHTLSSTPETIALDSIPETIADGWIFLGNINNSSASEVVGEPLIKGSQFTDSPIVPSVGALVTVNSGVNLRNNRPQEPNFDYKEQKVLAILKEREKLRILKVESVTTTTTVPTTKVWAQVHRCGSACN